MRRRRSCAASSSACAGSSPRRRRRAAIWKAPRRRRRAAMWRAPLRRRRAATWRVPLRRRRGGQAGAQMRASSSDQRPGADPRDTRRRRHERRRRQLAGGGAAGRGRLRRRRRVDAPVGGQPGRERQRLLLARRFPRRAPGRRAARHSVLRHGLSRRVQPRRGGRLRRRVPQRPDAEPVCALQPVREVRRLLGTGARARRVAASPPGTTRACATARAAPSCWRGVDADKDQSYFLFAVDPAVLARTLLSGRRPAQGATCGPRPARRGSAGGAQAGQPGGVLRAAPRGTRPFVERRALARCRCVRASIVDDARAACWRRTTACTSFTDRPAARARRQPAAPPRYVTGIDAARRHGAASAAPTQVVAGGLVATDAQLAGAGRRRCGARVQVKIRSRFAPQAARVVRRGPRRLRGRRGRRLARGDAGTGGGALRRRARASAAAGSRRGAGPWPRRSGRSSDAVTRPVRVAFATLGCKVNQYDTATMETALRARAARSCRSRKAPTCTS